jgi:hypothetical protein
VRFDDSVWREAIRGFSGRSLQIATSARAQTEQRGVALADLLPCEALGPDGTELAGCAKLYLPFIDAPASQRPFAFVLQVARDAQRELVWVFVAFGQRHPRRECEACMSGPIDNSKGDSPRSCRSSRRYGVVVRVRGLTAGFMASAYGSLVAAPRR